MAIIMALVGVMIITQWLWELLSPLGFIAPVSGWPSWGSVWIGSASRILLAVVLGIAAGSSRTWSRSRYSRWCLSHPGWLFYS